MAILDSEQQTSEQQATNSEPTEQVGEGVSGREGEVPEASPTPPLSHSPTRALLPFLRRCWLAAKRVGSVLAWFVGPILLIACSLVLFQNAILKGQVYYRWDTVVYYFPLADRFADVLRDGRLMLWTQYIFGGFPLFSDGEVGMLYPPNVIAYHLFFNEADAFIWLRVARYIMAGLFTYGYLRALRLNGFGATVGALSFAFGSFMIAQMHHTNVTNTAIWLPLTLCFVELAVSSVRRKRWFFATLAGISTGIQALGLHIQPLIMSGFFLAFYIPFRVLLCPIAWPRRKVSTGDLGSSISRSPKSEPAIGNEVKELAIESLAIGDGPGTNGSHDSGPVSSESSAGAKPVSVFRKIVGGRREVLRFAQDDTVWRSVGGRGRRFVGKTVRFVRADCLPWTGRHIAGSFHRVVLAGLLLGLIPAIAFGIAAAQVLPLVELGLFSFRGHGVNYQFATSFSLPVQNVLNLLFPYFFRFIGQEYYWSLWSEWESALYVGIAPLVLAILALFFARRRLVLFFGVMAAVSLVIAFGGYSPYPLWDQIRHLPGFSSLRVPSRFTMLTTFSLAVLAAFGADWLCRTLNPTPSRLQSRWGRLSRFAGVHGFGLFLMGLTAAFAGVAWWLVSFRAWTEKDPNAVKAAIQQSYLSLRNDRPWLTVDQVLVFLRHSLDPTNSRTEISLVLMLATLLLLLAWFAFRRLWRVWASILVLMVAVDMLLFATSFHPAMPISQLSTPNPATQWLISHNTDGRTRVYTTPGVRRTEPNRLLPFRLSEVTGYSSLQTKRNQDYMAKMWEYENSLMDLYGARYLVLPRNPTALPSYQYTGYNPNRPLADGPAGGRDSQATFYMNPPVRTDEVLVVSALRDAVEVLNGTNVAEVVAVDTNGERVTLQMKAGMDTAEWAYDRPDVTQHMRHNRPEVAGQVTATDPDGRRYPANMYFAELRLDKTRTIQRVEFRYTYPKAAMRLFGMALWENPSTAHQVLSRYRYLPRYQDDEVAIVENPSALPEAFLVPSARVMKPSDVLDTMAHGNFDPTREVLLEPPQEGGPPPDEGGADARIMEWLKGNSALPAGKATIVDYRSADVTIQTSAPNNSLLFLADSYYPGWKALVDGQEVKIYRANYLFRAVPVPAGEHEVTFVYQPESFFLGVSIFQFTVETLGLVWAGLLILPLVWTGVRWGVPMVRRRIIR